MLLDRDVEPFEGVVNVAETRVQNREAPRRHDARCTRRGEVVQNPPRFLLVPCSGFQMCEAERRTGNSARHTRHND